MKIINKFTLWYLAITVVVLLIGGFILFKSVLYEIDREAEIKLKAWIKITAHQLEEGMEPDSLEDVNNVMITELSYDAPLIPLQKTDSMGIFPPKLYGLDRKLTIEQSFKMHGKHYFISTYSFITEPDEIILGLGKSLVAIFFLLLAVLGLISVIISRRILSPFNKALNAIKTFSLKQQEPILLQETNTSEFRELNHFLKKMTLKAVDDYRTLKEFSENASHEIRTPLAVIRGKLELLMGTEINEEQAAYINTIQESIQKLSSVNHSLLLLTKLENQEYSTTQRINFSAIVTNTLSSFEELMDMKSIACTQEIEEEVSLLINPYLAELLLGNLMSNAIRHNHHGGRLHFVLTKKSMKVENTGTPPEVPTEELFKRFKKSNQSSDSTGLGLAIVKQICIINDFRVSYVFEDSLHKLEVWFNEWSS